MDAEKIVNDALSRLGASNNVHKEKLIAFVNDMQDTIECKEFRSIISENTDIQGAEWLAITFLLMFQIKGKPIVNNEELFNGLRNYFESLRGNENEQV